MVQHVSLKQLKYFITVAEELSFRSAAERLCITQPPLSRQIKLLEELIGAKLFNRDRGGVSLTEAGELLLPDARKLLQDSELVVQRVKPDDDTSTKPTIRISITTVVDVTLFAGLELNLEQLLPSVKVAVKRQISSNSIHDLNNGKIDVAIIGQHVRTEDIKVENLVVDPLVACISTNHRLARKRSVSILDLAEDKLFWFDRKLNPAYYDHCEQVFAEAGFAPNRLPEPADHHILLGLVAEGHGVALVPSSLHEITRKNVTFKKLAEGKRLGIQISLAYRASENRNEVLEMIKMLVTMLTK